MEGVDGLTLKTAVLMEAISGPLLESLNMADMMNLSLAVRYPAAARILSREFNGYTIRARDLLISAVLGRGLFGRSMMPRVADIYRALIEAGDNRERVGDIMYGERSRKCCGLEMADAGVLWIAIKLREPCHIVGIFMDVFSRMTSGILNLVNSVIRFSAKMSIDGCGLEVLRRLMTTYRPSQTSADLFFYTSALTPIRQARRTRYYDFETNADVAEISVYMSRVIHSCDVGRLFDEPIRFAIDGCMKPIYEAFRRAIAREYPWQLALPEKMHTGAI